MPVVDPRDKAVGMIEHVDSDDYEAYADMVMRSLRGSWRRPQTRIIILEMLAESTEIYTEEVRDSIAARCENFKKAYFDGWHGGRVFRHVYQDRIEVEYGSETARELAAYIPDDMTWDQHRLDTMESETEVKSR